MCLKVKQEWIFALTVSLTLALQRSGVLKHLHTLRTPLKAAKQEQRPDEMLLLMLVNHEASQARAARTCSATLLLKKHAMCARAEFSSDIHRKLTSGTKEKCHWPEPARALTGGRRFEHFEVSYCHFCLFQNKSLLPNFCFHASYPALVNIRQRWTPNVLLTPTCPNWKKTDWIQYIQGSVGYF